MTSALVPTSSLGFPPVFPQRVPHRELREHNPVLGEEHVLPRPQIPGELEDVTAILYAQREDGVRKDSVPFPGGVGDELPFDHEKGVGRGR